MDRNPGASLSDLAEHLGVTRATASANTERLVQRNFVDRCDNFADRMQVIQFMKNLAILGRLLMVYYYGSGQVSLDEKI